MGKTNLIVFILLVLLSSCRKRNYIKNDNYWDKFEISENPGNLKFFSYLNTEKESSPKTLVVLLHGCTQNAEEIAVISGWKKLANEIGFALLCPQQKVSNNTSRCYNWFLKSDNEQKGEVISIHNSILQLKSMYPSIEKVCIYGVSAGAAMAVSTLANYPETFYAGASLAGMPYKSASSSKDLKMARSGNLNKTPKEWGEKVLSIHNSSKTFPKLLVMHGKEDKAVDINNSKEITKQWTYVLGIDYDSGQYSENFANNESVAQFAYVNSNMDTLVSRLEIENLGHQIPIDTGEDIYKGGEESKYATDINFHSTYWIAKFFELL